MADTEQFKVELQDDYTCKIEFGGRGLLDVVDEIKKCVELSEKMKKWMDDPAVTDAQVEQFRPMYTNLLHTISFLWDLARRGGVTEEGIKKYINVPL
jgi:hypothetical protein